MNSPSISIILPAFNSEAFIAEAIRSVLSQTCTDFELIIINDGSTDRTEEIILSFNDPRIQYHRNETNSGLIYTLNKAIDLAKANYIARMDADDSCLPERLSIQKNYLDQYDDIDVVAAPVIFIDHAGKETGVWELDRKTILPARIKKIMPYENCVAHPSVMIRAAVLKEFRYKAYQKNIEDYDLWLRLLNRGYNIGKTEIPLLLYRVHDASITGTTLKKKNFFFKHAAMKRKFLWREMKEGQINGFTIKVIVSFLGDLLKGTGKSVKNVFKS
jgi:glycosyltransferase involved in cell wall biosynthesis